MGMMGGAELTLFITRRGIHDARVLGEESPFHEEGTGLETIKSSPM